MKQMKKKITAAVMAAVFMIFTGLVFGVFPDPAGSIDFKADPAVISSETCTETEVSPASAENDGSKYTESESEKSIFVYVCGHIKRPDVYELPAGSRVYEAINAAGGASDDADLTLLNLADILSDGQKIFVPAEGEQLPAEVYGGKDPEDEGQTASASDGIVNINTAGKDILKTLPGIGDAKAEAIISYRLDTGGFSSIEEIMNVPGISSGTFEKISGRITID